MEGQEVLEMVEAGVYRTQLLLACEGLLSARRCDYLRNETPTSVKGGESLETALYNLALMWLKEVFLSRKDHEALDLAGDERARRNLEELFEAESMQESKDQLASMGIRES